MWYGMVTWYGMVYDMVWYIEWYGYMAWWNKTRVTATSSGPSPSLSTMHEWPGNQ